MKRTLQVIVAVVTALTIAGCTFNPSTRDEAAGSSAEAGIQSSTPTIFTQNLNSRTMGDAGTVAITEESTGQSFRSSNIGISFEATDLADPRLDPAASNRLIAVEGVVGV